MLIRLLSTWYRVATFFLVQYTRCSLCRFIRLHSKWCRAAAFLSASGAALSQKIPTVKRMSNQPALWTPGTYLGRAVIAINSTHVSSKSCGDVAKVIWRRKGDVSRVMGIGNKEESSRTWNRNSEWNHCALMYSYRKNVVCGSVYSVHLWLHEYDAILLKQMCCTNIAETGWSRTASRCFLSPRASPRRMFLKH
jgi:hypothetical protein